MGSDLDNYCLKWNDFQAHVSGACHTLREEADFFDVVLGCDQSQGRTLQAHKVILAACSSFFKDILKQHEASTVSSHTSPFIYLRGVPFTHMAAILDFMYQGEVSVRQTDLSAFLAVAEDLQVKGLAQPGCDPIQPTPDELPAAASPLPNIKLEEPPSSPANPLASTSDFQSVKVEPLIMDEAMEQIVEGNPEDFLYETVEETDTGSEDPLHRNDETTLSAAGSPSWTNGEVVRLADGRGGQCLRCGKGFALFVTAVRHFKLSHFESENLPCPYCQSVMRTKSYLKDHLRRKHKVYQGPFKGPPPT
eukprot:maker-scaffold691_size110934-snap-gene-0.34 protein:Tk06100 transcript:maker-scaffold691_size110934-snap-gene-0.34-mRNA-1 annotation:"longitudinals lacking"